MRNKATVTLSPASSIVLDYLNFIENPSKTKPTEFSAAILNTRIVRRVNTRNNSQTIYECSSHDGLTIFQFAAIYLEDRSLISEMISAGADLDAPIYKALRVLGCTVLPSGNLKEEIEFKTNAKGELINLSLLDQLILIRPDDVRKIALLLGKNCPIRRLTSFSHLHKIWMLTSGPRIDSIFYYNYGFLPAFEDHLAAYTTLGITDQIPQEHVLKRANYAIKVDFPLYRNFEELSPSTAMEKISSAARYVSLNQYNDAYVILYENTAVKYHIKDFKTPVFGHDFSGNFLHLVASTLHQVRSNELFGASLLWNLLCEYGFDPKYKDGDIPSPVEIVKGNFHKLVSNYKYDSLPEIFDFEIPLEPDERIAFLEEIDIFIASQNAKNNSPQRWLEHHCAWINFRYDKAIEFGINPELALEEKNLQIELYLAQFFSKILNTSYSQNLNLANANPFIHSTAERSPKKVSFETSVIDNELVPGASYPHHESLYSRAPSVASKIENAIMELTKLYTTEIRNLRKATRYAKRTKNPIEYEVDMATTAEEFIMLTRFRRLPEYEPHVMINKSIHHLLNSPLPNIDDIKAKKNLINSLMAFLQIRDLSSTEALNNHYKHNLVDRVIVLKLCTPRLKPFTTITKASSAIRNLARTDVEAKDLIVRAVSNFVTLQSFSCSSNPNTTQYLERLSLIGDLKLSRHPYRKLLEPKGKITRYLKRKHEDLSDLDLFEDCENVVETFCGYTVPRIMQYFDELLFHIDNYSEEECFYSCAMETHHLLRDIEEFKIDNFIACAINYALEQYLNNDDPNPIFRSVMIFFLNTDGFPLKEELRNTLEITSFKRAKAEEAEEVEKEEEEEVEREEEEKEKIITQSSSSSSSSSSLPSSRIAVDDSWESFISSAPPETASRAALP